MPAIERESNLYTLKKYIMNYNIRIEIKHTSSEGLHFEMRSSELIYLIYGTLLPCV